jgi:hypothetical protein
MQEMTALMDKNQFWSFSPTAAGVHSSASAQGDSSAVREIIFVHDHSPIKDSNDRSGGRTRKVPVAGRAGIGTKRPSPDIHSPAILGICGREHISTLRIEKRPSNQGF